MLQEKFINKITHIYICLHIYICTIQSSFIVSFFGRDYRKVFSDHTSLPNFDLSILGSCQQEALRCLAHGNITYPVVMARLRLIRTWSWGLLPTSNSSSCTCTCFHYSFCCHISPIYQTRPKREGK